MHWRRGQPIGLSGDEFTPPDRHAELLRGEQFALEISSRWFLFFSFLFSPFFSPFLSLLLVLRLPFAFARPSARPFAFPRLVVSSFYELQCLAPGDAAALAGEIETGSESSEGSANRG